MHSMGHTEDCKKNIKGGWIMLNLKLENEMWPCYLHIFCCLQHWVAYFHIFSWIDLSPTMETLKNKNVGIPIMILDKLYYDAKLCNFVVQQRLIINSFLDL